MKTKPLLQIILLAALVVPAAGEREWGWDEETTPETELGWAQRCCREGRDFTAHGLFREAEERLGGGIGSATGKLRQLEQREATVAPLRDFVDRLQAVRDRFDDDWTNAVAEAFALEGPIKSYVATNPVIQAELAWPLRSFDWLRQELDAGNRRDAGVQLHNFQDALRRQIVAFEELRRLEPSFRAVLADLERAKAELAEERAKPFDAERALRIARDYVAVARGKIEEPGGSLWDLECAEKYLADVRKAGGPKAETAEIEAAIAETKCLADVAGARYYLRKAREWLAKDRPDNAASNVRIAEEIYLPRLKEDPAFGKLSAEADELKRAAGRMLRPSLTATSPAP